MLTNTKIEANFADVRNYIYQGRKIGQQVHWGYDLSSTQHADVMAANGKVVYAAPLGMAISAGLPCMKATW